MFQKAYKFYYCNLFMGDFYCAEKDTNVAVCPFAIEIIGLADVLKTTGEVYYTQSLRGVSAVRVPVNEQRLSLLFEDACKGCGIYNTFEQINRQLHKAFLDNKEAASTPMSEEDKQKINMLLSLDRIEDTIRLDTDEDSKDTSRGEGERADGLG